MIKKLLFGLVVCATLSVLLTSCKSEEKDDKEKPTKEYRAMVVQTASRQLQSNYSAIIRGKQDVDIRTKVQGYITDIKVKEGAFVTKGETLFVIDQSQYQIALYTAKAKVDAAQAKVKEAELQASSKEMLFKENVISEFDLLMARTKLASAQAELAEAQAAEQNAQNNFNYTLVKSPVDGVLGTLPFRVGTLVSPSDSAPMTSVSDNSEMYVYFSMSESQILSLKRQHGAIENALMELPPVELILNDGSTYKNKGKIEAISGIIDANTGTVTLRAKFPNPDRTLISGGIGTILLPYDRTDNVVIPQSATTRVQDKIYVRKVVDGIAKTQIINVFEISNGKEYIVETGLKAGDTILLDGGNVRDNTPVTIREFVEAIK